MGRRGELKKEMPIVVFSASPRLPVSASLYCSLAHCSLVSVDEQARLKRFGSLKRSQQSEKLGIAAAA